MTVTAAICAANPLTLGAHGEQSSSGPVGNASANRASNTISTNASESKEVQQQSRSGATTSVDGTDEATDSASGEALGSNDDEQDPEPAAEVDVEPSAPMTPPLRLDVALGLASWFVQEKAIFGPTIRIGGRWVWFTAETNLVLVTRSTPSFGHTLFGATFGTYFELSPLRTRRLEVHFGLGSDYHWLAAINTEEWKFAFAARASLHAWLSEHVGVFVAGRGYLAKSDGLGLGISESGVSQFPMLFSVGVEWRPR